MEITWSAPEYHHYEKHPRWHLGVGVVFGLIILFALWQGNFLFAVFMAIAGFFVSTWGTRPPEMTTFTITEREVVIGRKKTYPFEKIEGFAIIESPGHPPELILKTKERLHALLRIIVPEEKQEQIKEFLVKKIPEIEHQESLAEHVGRMLQF